MAEAVERTMRDGGVLVAEAGTGTGKSVAYLVPALGRALAGERVVVSTHTLPLQEQLVHRDVPALQAALGTDVAVAVLKGRANYLCPRRWQLLRSAAATGDEARLVLKTLVWRTETTVGDRAELNLTPSEAALWPRISADDESCEARRCARTPGGCYLERARERAAAAGVVVVNHALLLHDARMRSALLPETEHVVVDEAHRLEDVAADTFGHRLDAARLRRDLDRVARATLVAEALRDPSRAALADDLRAEVARARERAAETFAALAALLPAAWSGGEDRLRVTAALRGVDDRWLAVEVAAERLADALAGTEGAADRLAAPAADEDAGDELRAAASALSGAGA
ncbi:MAG TPA: DEAD/DEAH box helicase, partial [Candidatus Limnocylindrales bacterium]|nr:DEAD/DEAH box helicase [Candidatus Limnocylindrales bacterium]